MNTVKGKAVTEALQNGLVVEFGERYYRLNPTTNKLEYSDYNMNTWLKSNVKSANGLASGGLEFNLVEMDGVK